VGRRGKRAIKRLRESVSHLQEGDQPMSPELRGGAWGQLGRGIIDGWVQALGRDLDLISRAWGRARRYPLQEPGIRAMEEALWRLDAAREKLHAATSLGLGVRHLDIGKDPVQFKTDPRKIGTALRALHDPVATELDNVGQQLAARRAIALRNELSHGIAPLTQVGIRCDFEGVAVRHGRVGRWRNYIDYPPSWRTHGNIRPETLWADAVADVAEALSMLIKSVELLAELLGREGSNLPPPAQVFWDEDAGSIALSPPAGAQPTAPIAPLQ
jgi:hypothetical protein